MFLPRFYVMIKKCGNIRDREVACSASDHPGSNFESCVWRAVSSNSLSHKFIRAYHYKVSFLKVWLFVAAPVVIITAILF